jgi:UDP-N-acetylglucosamine diphosphorylase/glucosamine-1-phosphate N-acetyltransferase
MRPVADIRCGVLTLKEKWEYLLKDKISYFTRDYLRNKFQCIVKEENIFINGSLFANKNIFDEIFNLKSGQALIGKDNSELLGFKIPDKDLEKIKLLDNDNIISEHLIDFEFVSSKNDYIKITRPWDIFKINDIAIKNDFMMITKGRKSSPISSTNRYIGENIFIEEGAIVEFSTINATNSYVYIGKNSEIMENCAIRGSFALCNDSVLKMGAKIYGATTIGPHCKVGGEVNNSVFFGYSNKAHDGFLGNSVISEWCNLGADTNNSNLKNTYDIVKLWSYPEEHFISTGLQFCGLIMGDHSKSAINTMFNTGTVVGVSANIFGEGFPRNYIPSFSWGGAFGFKKYNYKKAIEVAKNVCERRSVILSDYDVEILTTIYNMSE